MRNYIQGLKVLKGVLKSDSSSQVVEEFKNKRILDFLLPELGSSFNQKFYKTTPSYSWWQLVLKQIDSIESEKRLAFILSGVGLFESRVEPLETEIILFPALQEVRAFYFPGIAQRLQLNYEDLKSISNSEYSPEYFKKLSLPANPRTKVIMIGGGDSYLTYSEFFESFRYDKLRLDKGPGSWRSWLRGQLEPDFEVLDIPMPNTQNAKYVEWKTQFSKLSLAGESVILIGHSLGGIFLTKYLVEETIDFKVKALHLVAAPFERVGEFDLPKNISSLPAKSVYLYHAKNDEIVDFTEMAKYKKVLPNAQEIILEQGGLLGHMLQPIFPELLTHIHSGF
jgi:uncharacterized protein